MSAVDELPADIEGCSLLVEDTEAAGSPNQDYAYNSVATFIIFFYPALGGLLFGYDIGATSAVMLQIQSNIDSDVRWYSMVSGSSALLGILTSMSMFGAMLGCVVCLRYADDLGRRRSILLAALLYFVGSIMEWLSGYPGWGASAGIVVLITGRLVYGLGIGIAMQGVPAYIGEMSPPSIRGLLMSLKEAFIVLGMLLGYSIGYAYSTTPGGWRSTYGWASAMAVVMFGGMYSLPSSAPWLAMHGRLNDAISAQQYVTPNLTWEQTQHLTLMASKSLSGDTLKRSNSAAVSIWSQLSSPEAFQPLIAGVGMVAFQQLTGQPSALFYADSLFRDVGVSSVATIAISLFKLVATLLTTITVDRYGRKKLLYIGCSMMLIALLSLSVVFAFPYSSVEDCNSHTAQRSCPNTCIWDTSTVQCNLDAACTLSDPCTCCTTSGLDTHKLLMLASLFVYIGGYQVGFGPIVWLLISEIFPLEVRGRAVAIAVVTNFFLNTVVTLLFPVELRFLGAAPTFFLYAVILVLALFFIHRNVPETKGLSLQEIEQSFARLRGQRASEHPAHTGIKPARHDTRAVNGTHKRVPHDIEMVSLS